MTSIFPVPHSWVPKSWSVGLSIPPGHEEFSTFYSGKATPYTYRTAAGLRIGPEVNKFHSLWHSWCSFMKSPLLLASSTKDQKQTFILWILSALQVERAPRSSSDLCETIPGLGSSNMEFSQIQGARTHCTERTNQTAASKSESSADLSKVFTAQIFAFPRLYSLGVGQLLEMFFRRQEAEVCKTLCLALPETPPQFFQP